jgi:hypothetical protein
MGFFGSWQLRFGVTRVFGFLRIKTRTSCWQLENAEGIFQNNYIHCKLFVCLSRLRGNSRGLAFRLPVSAIGFKAYLRQGSQTAQTPTDAKIIGVVDRRFGAQSSVSLCRFEILLGMSERSYSRCAAKEWRLP